MARIPTEKRLYTQNDGYWDEAKRCVVYGSLNRSAEELEAEIRLRQQEIDNIKFRELPMLKGEGFIVIDPKNPRFTGQEHATTEAANEEANDIAYQSGKAIIYAPIGVVKPQRPTVVTQPTELVKQALNSVAGQIAAPKAE